MEEAKSLATKQSLLYELREIEQRKVQILNSMFKVCEHEKTSGFSGCEVCSDCQGKRTYKPMWGDIPDWNEWKPYQAATEK